MLKLERPTNYLGSLESKRQSLVLYRVFEGL